MSCNIFHNFLNCLWWSETRFFKTACTWPFSNWASKLQQNPQLYLHDSWDIQCVLHSFLLIQYYLACY